ncbi:hypothetical protein PRIPAC_72278, partial [Pristionchus pacificus]|uniref:Uncharacterized protein n=1 Tax=Pristionchus pacificus TaxID=54126 RepID=A0A2A6B4I1_PRIPA
DLNFIFRGCTSFINILKAFDHKFLCCKNNVVHGDVAKECESQTYHFKTNTDCKAGQTKVAKDDKYFLCCNKGFLTASPHQ